MVCSYRGIWHFGGMKRFGEKIDPDFKSVIVLTKFYDHVEILKIHNKNVTVITVQ